MILQSSEIQLTDLRFYAHHGVLPQERSIGAQFSVTIVLHLSLDNRAFLHDCLEGTVNYAEVYTLVQQEMAKPSQLLEHVATRILRALFQHFYLVEQASVEVMKLAPPIQGFEGSDCRVRLHATR